MEILRIRLRDVRRFAGRSLEIGPLAAGANVWAAPNEAGKSTTLDALVALFTKDRRSAASDVRALIPYQGGSPWVEATVRHDGKVWTLAKRFGRGAACEIRDEQGVLIAQGDEGEAWIAKTFPHAQLCIDLLWARQRRIDLDPEGMGSVEKREREEMRAARRGLLAEAAQSLDAGLGGARFDAVRAMLQKELDTLRTPTGKARVGGGWERALADSAARASVARGAIARRDAAQAAIAARARAAGAQQEAQAALDAALADVARTEAVYVEALRVWEEASAAAVGADQARQAYVEKEALAVSAAEAQAAYVHAQGALSQAQARVEGAEVALEGARLAHVAAQEAVRVAQSRAQQADAAVEDVDRLHKAALAHRVRADVAASRAAAAVPVWAQDEIADWEAALARADALAPDAGGAVAEVVWSGGPAVEGWGDRPVPMADGATFRVGESVFVIRAPGGTARAEERARLLSKAEAFAARAEGATPRAARAGWEAHRRAMEQADLLERRHAALLDAVDPVEGDVDVLDAALAAARQEAAAARTDLDACRARCDAAADAFFQAQDAWTADRAVFAGAQAEAARALVPAVPPGEARAEADKALVEAEAAADRLAFRASALAKRDKAQEAREAAQHAVAVASAQAQSAREALARSEGELAGFGGQDPWSTAEQAIAEAEAATKVAMDWEGRVAALARAIAALDAAQAARKVALYAPAEAALLPMIQAVFGPAQARFGEESLNADAICRDGVVEGVEALSGGARDALAVLTRLAFAQVLRARGMPWPVVLDDALAQIDEDRVAALGSCAAHLAQDGQILLLAGRLAPPAGWPGAPVPTSILV